VYAAATVMAVLHRYGGAAPLWRCYMAVLHGIAVGGQARGHVELESVVAANHLKVRGVTVDAGS